MQPLNVAIVAVEDFSPFHFSVPCIIFSDKVAAKKRFEVQLCAEQPGIVSSQDGFSINAAYGYEAVEAADIVVIPWWGTTAHRPPQSLLDALNRARQNGAQIGSTVANQIARRMIVPPHREGGQAQFIEQPVAKNTKDQRINVLLDYLRQHLNEPHNLDELALRVMMSRRTLTRHFMKATGSSVAEWLIAERLRRSQTLLESSQLPVERIAEQVGFQSPVTWRQHFKSHFGVSPAEWRKTFRGD